MWTRPEIHWRGRNTDGLLHAGVSSRFTCCNDAFFGFRAGDEVKERKVSLKIWNRNLKMFQQMMNCLYRLKLSVLQDRGEISEMWCDLCVCCLFGLLYPSFLPQWFKVESLNCISLLIRAPRCRAPSTEFLCYARSPTKAKTPGHYITRAGTASLNNESITRRSFLTTVKTERREEHQNITES